MLDIHDAHRKFINTPSGLILSEDAARLRYAPPPDVLAGDIFSGCGGAALGMKQAGLRVLFGVELWETAAITYLINLGADVLRLHIENDERRARFEKEIVSKNKKTGLFTVLRSGMARPRDRQGTEAFWLWDVTKLTGKMILDDLGLKPGELDVLHGSPPCQGFSNAGKRNTADPRNNLMGEYARLICEIQPKAFSLEQVPGVRSMFTPDGQPVLDAFLDQIERGGYAKRKTLEKMIAAQGGKEMLMHRPREDRKRASEVDLAPDTRKPAAAPTDQFSMFD